MVRDDSLSGLAAGLREGIARAPSGPRIQERVREGAGNMKGIARMSFLVVVGLALGAVAPAAAQAPPPPAVVVAAAEATPPLPDPDAAITAAIKARIDANKLFRNAQLIVSTSNGHVTLSGMVTNDFAHEEALRIARTTVGVVEIDDQIRMEISSPSAPTRN
jgi:hypothetical protein